MKRLYALFALVLTSGPLAAQPVPLSVPAPAIAAPGGIVINPVTLPQGFLQPQTLRYALWATHMTRKRLDVFRNKFPQFSNERVDIALQAAHDLENSLKETIKHVDSNGVPSAERAAQSAGALDQVRRSLAFWEASASAPEVRTLLDQPSPDAAFERSQLSFKQLSRLVSHENTGWPNSTPGETPLPVFGAAAPKGGGNEDKPLKSPEKMETLWNMMPESLASVARAEYGRAYREAYYDGLTGIHSRRYLDHHAEEFAEHGEQHQLVGDIDHFKKVNDEMGGHQIGDATLKEVAQIWGQELDKEGEVGVRWGGEEFWGRVRGGEAKAVEIATRINERVRTEVHLKTGLPKPLTISIGIAGTEKKALNTKLEDFHKTFKRADDAVFDAKHKGRDRIVVQAAEAFSVRYAPPAPPAAAKKGFFAFLFGAVTTFLASLYRRRE